jgi:uncharacterized protein involved in exopolysaccharide biosynthesis
VSEVRGTDAFAASESGEAPSIVTHALQALRGRYKLAAGLALLSAIVCSVLGWLQEEPVYQSNGMIRITPLMHRILYSSQTEKNSPPPAPGIFEAFVQSQVSIIRSQQLIDSVMQTDEWVATGEGRDEKAIGQFWRALKVRHPPRTELIQVSYRHPDPAVATTAVRQMIRSYRIHQGQQSAEERIQGLIKNDAELTEKLETLRGEITDIASLHGTTDLTRLFNMQMMALTETESAFRNMRMDLIVAETSVTDVEDVTTLHEDEIARFDALMMSYLQKRDHLENELVIWRSRYTEEMPGRATSSLAG